MYLNGGSRSGSEMHKSCLSVQTRTHHSAIIPARQTSNKACKFNNPHDRAGDHILGRRYSLSIEEMPQAVVVTIKMVALAQQAGVFDPCTLSRVSLCVTQPIQKHYSYSRLGEPKVEPKSRFHCIYSTVSPNVCTVISFGGNGDYG